MFTMLLISAAVVVFVLLTYGGAIALRLLNQFALHSMSKGALVLTFDDGPGAEMSRRIQALLSREGIKGTFFLTGFRAEKHQNLPLEAKRNGHQLASHGFYHLNAWRRPFASLIDTSKGLRELRQVEPGATSFRPPYGKATLLTYLACWLQGYRVVFWTIDCKDAEKHTIRRPHDVVEELLRKGGGVVLMHDLDFEAGAFEERPGKVLALCEALIQAARRNGMRICTVDELYAGSARQQGQ
jgi:peptidoglycan/xylan/chitin deacetylase (PgdA/CDA1 family)